MTPTEVQTVISEIQSLWPRLKWSPAERDVFEERAERVAIELAQAEAAIRNVKATVDEFPKVSTLLKALDGAKNRPSVQSDQPKPLSTQLGEMARRNGMDLLAPRIEIVLADWRGKVKAAKRIRGEVPKRYYESFKQDMMELAHASEQECLDWWYSINEGVEFVEQIPGAGKWAVERMRASVNGLVT